MKERLVGSARERWVYFSGVALLVVSWLFRPLQPSLPLWDPDTWGYLYPALSWLDGGPFQQMHGRHGFYPSLLLLFLQSGGGLERVPFYQHLFGLGGAVLAWTAWLRWLRVLCFGREFSLWVWWGLVVVGGAISSLWMFNPHVWMQENDLRPEAVLGFFVFGQLACGMDYLGRLQRLATKEKWSSWEIWGLALNAVGALAFAWMALALKPSWIFAAAGTWVFVAIGWSIARARWVVASSLVMGVIFWGGASAFYQHWLQEDDASRTFLPMTLTTIHAPWVLAAWEDELAKGRTAGGVLGREGLEKFVENFRRELATARQDAGWYKRLGLDSDYLMYRSSLNRPLGEAGVGMEEGIAFHKRGYFLAWMKFPLPMAEKVWGQFDYFLRPEPRIFAARQADWPRYWERTGGELEKYFRYGPGEISQALLQSNRQSFLKAAVPPAQPRPLFLGWIAESLARLAPFLLAGFLLWWAALPWGYQDWFWPGLAAAYFLSLPAGNAFAVSLTHSLDLFRYRFTFAPSYAWALAAIFCLLVLWGAGQLRAWWNRNRGMMRQGESPG